MLWVYILAGTAGIVMLVPAVLRALERMPSDAVTGTLGFGATTFGACGIVLQQIDLRTSSVLVASFALGGAVGAIHPEILNALRRSASATAAPETDPTPLSGNDS